MNESELENQLRKLRPAPPSRALEETIERELAACTMVVETPTHVRIGTRARSRDARPSWLMLWVDRLLWSGVGAAAAAVALVVVQRPHAVPATVQPEPPTVAQAVAPLDSAALQPVMATEEDLGWRDEGVHFDSRGQPLLKLTRAAVERRAWADLKNAGVVRVETPRLETMWVPVPVH